MKRIRLKENVLEHKKREFLNSRNIKVQFFIMGVYYEKIFCYTDNVNSKEEYKRGDQMEAAQRIRLIRIIEKMEKNP